MLNKRASERYLNEIAVCVDEIKLIINSFLDDTRENIEFNYEDYADINGYLMRIVVAKHYIMEGLKE